MSDVYLGPGWWLASDGKWYDPSSHPDASYRAAFVSDDAASTATEDLPSEDAADDATVVEDVPVVEPIAIREEPAHSVTTTATFMGLPDTIDAASLTAPTIDCSDGDPAEITSVDAAAKESDAPAEVIDLRDSVLDPDGGVASALPGRTQLEIQPKKPVEASRPVVNVNPAVPTTDLVHVQAASRDRSSVDRIDLFFLLLLFVGGLLVVGGTFLEWTVGSDGQLGWDRPDGIVVVVAGVAASTAVGPLFIGLRSVIRPVAMIAGVVALMVIGVATVTTLTEAERTGLSLGSGIYVVLAGAIAVLAGSAALGEPNYR